MIRNPEAYFNAPKFKLHSVKCFIMDRFHLVANRFMCRFEIVDDGEWYGRPLTEHDYINFLKSAKEKFPKLAIHHLEKIFGQPLLQYDYLAPFGMANGKSYHRRFIFGNIALYFAAADKMKNAVSIIRNAKGGSLYETIIHEARNDEIIVAEFNKYLAMLRKPEIDIEDLLPSPIQF